MDQDDTVGAAGTEDGGGGGILEDGYAGHLVHVQHTEFVGLAVTGHTVDKQQRGVVGSSTLAAEVHGNVVTTGLAALLDGGKTSHTACKCVGKVGDLCLNEFLVCHGLDGAGHRNLFLVSVGHRNGRIKLLLVLFKEHVDFSLVSDGNLFCDITHKRNFHY